jgi:hypothetical protein
MLMTEKKLTRGLDLSLPWLGIAALSGLILSASVVVNRWRRRTYKKQEDWMNAYVRGCLDRNRRSS